MSKQSKILFLLAAFALIGAGAIRFILGAWIPFIWVILGTSAFMAIGAVWFDLHLYKEFFSMKTTRQGMSMGTLIVLVTALLVAINFIAVRKYKTFDLSAAKLNTLSDQSIKLLKNLKEDLKVIYFYKEGSEGVEDNRRAFVELLKKYQDQSSFVKLEFIELNQRPDLAESYGVTKGSGLVFVEYQGRKNKIDKIDEQELTGALVKVTREKDKVVYFVIGHGEGDLEDATDANGMNALKKLLEGNRYLVKALVLNATPSIPEDADVLAVVGPKQAFLPNEIKTIEAYLQRGKGLILAIDSQVTSGLEGLLAKLGIAPNNDFIVQVLDTPMGKAINPAMTPIMEFSTTHAITKPFTNSQFAVFRLPTSFKKLPGVAHLAIEDLAKSSISVLSYKDKNFKTQGVEGQFEMAFDIKGKWDGDASKPEFEAVVFGDSEFLNNQLLYQNLNRDLILNSVAFLAKEENIISITPKEVGVSQLQFTETQFYIFLFGFIIPLPLLLMSTAGVLWYRRRYA